MTTTTLTITPPCEFLNANQRYHWRKKAELTKAWREAAYTAVMTGFHPYRYDRAHITFAVRFPDNRRRDVHNLYGTAKAAIDGIVQAGLLADDRDEFLVGPDMRRTLPNGTPEVVITITPLETP